MAHSNTISSSSSVKIKITRGLLLLRAERIEYKLQSVSCNFSIWVYLRLFFRAAPSSADFATASLYIFLGMRGQIAVGILLRSRRRHIPF